MGLANRIADRALAIFDLDSLIKYVRSLRGVNQRVAPQLANNLTGNNGRGLITISPEDCISALNKVKLRYLDLGIMMSNLDSEFSTISTQKTDFIDDTDDGTGILAVSFQIRQMDNDQETYKALKAQNSGRLSQTVLDLWDFLHNINNEGFKYEFRINGAPGFLSDPIVLKSNVIWDNYIYFVALFSINGVLTPTLIRKENSGRWNLLELSQGIIGENTLHGFNQGTINSTINFQIGRDLDKILLNSNMTQYDGYEFRKKFKDLNISFPNSHESSNSGADINSPNIFNIEIALLRDQFVKVVTDGIEKNKITNGDTKSIKEISSYMEKINFPKGFIPNFNARSNKKPDYQLICGISTDEICDVYIFEAVYEGRKIYWHIANSRLTNNVWIVDITFKEHKDFNNGIGDPLSRPNVTSFGTAADRFDGGILIIDPYVQMIGNTFLDTTSMTSNTKYITGFKLWKLGSEEQKKIAA